MLSRANHERNRILASRKEILRFRRLVFIEIEKYEALT